MSLISALALFTSLACVISLTILPPLQSTAAALVQSSVALAKFEIDPPFSANVSSGSSNILKIQCDGERYGKNLNVASCSNVFNYIDKRVLERTFADRNTGIQADILLPWRIYDNKALCFVQPALKKGTLSARANFEEIGGAAYTLLKECVTKRGIGGVAAQIGGDNNLYVVIANYQPRVRCDQSSKPAPPWNSCHHIWGDMQTEQERQIFGRGSDPTIQVKLPFVMKAIDARCEAIIDMSGKPTTGTWYQIWEATVAIASMCIRAKEKGGKATGLGLNQDMVINMYDATPDLAVSMVNKTTDNSSSANPTLSQPLANVTKADSSILNTWVGSDAQNFSMEAISDYVLGKPFEFSSNLEQGDSILATLPGNVSTHNSQDASA